MNPDRLAKFSKEDLIKFHIRQAEKIEYLENRIKDTYYVGKVNIEGKFYLLYIKSDEV